MATLTQLRADVRSAANPTDAVFLQRFFKTGPGQYGAGDKFLGLRVPTLRSLVRKYKELPLADRFKLLRSKYHEERLLALMLLVQAYERADEKTQAKICRAYLGNTKYVNNWDLVDSSAPYIVGPEVGKSVSFTRLERLAGSKLLWERRIAMLATFQGIKQNEWRPALKIGALLLEDRHDLIHKAVGWMLREVGKRDRAVEEKSFAGTAAPCRGRCCGTRSSISRRRRGGSISRELFDPTEPQQLLRGRPSLREGRLNSGWLACRGLSPPATRPSPLRGVLRCP